MCRLLLFLLLVPAVFMVGAEELKITGDNWENFINPDNTGAYIEILNEVFKKNNISYQLVIKSYGDGKKLLEAGKVDAMIGVYADEMKANVVYPKWHIDSDIVQVVFQKNKFKWLGDESLKGKKVAWQKGFEMDMLFSVPFKAVEVNNIESGFQALKNGEIDFFIDEKFDMAEYLRKNPKIKKDDFEFVIIRKKRVFVVFTKAAGAKYADIWDREMLKLLQNGRITAIYKKYHMLNENETLTQYYYESAK